LKSLGICNFVNASGFENPFNEEKSWDYLKVNVWDDEEANISSFFDEVCDFVKQSKREKKKC